MSHATRSEELADLLLAPAAPGELEARLGAMAVELSLETVAALKRRVDAAKLRSARRALEIAAVAEAVAARVADPLAPGLALWARGNALYHLSRFGEALGCYRHAEAIYAGAGRAYEVAGLQINQVAVLQDLGQFAEALATAERARTACLAFGEPARRWLALLEMNSGAAYQQLARPEEALAAYGRGRAILVAVGDLVETARIDINRANVLQEMGRFAAAEALYGAARDALAASGSEQEVARAEHNMGKLAYRRGRHQEALAHLEAARAGYAAIPNPTEVAKADLYRALVYSGLSMLEEAAALAGASVRVFARERTRWEEALALIVQGGSLARLGSPEAAAPLLERARRLLRRQGATERIPPLDLERAELALAAGHTAHGRRLAARVARQLRPDDWPALAARARLALSASDLAAAPPRPAAAARRAREALELAARFGLPEAAAAHHALARAHEAAGDLPAAWAEAARAVAAAEGLRARLPLDDLRLAFLDAHQPIYGDAARLALLAHSPPVALAAVELALSAPLPRPPLPAAAPELRAQLGELRERWAYLQTAAGEPGEGLGRAEAERRRREVELAIADLTRRLAVRAGPGALAPERGAALDPAGAAEGLRALQARLGGSEALLVYAPAGEAVFALLVTAGGVERRRCPVGVAAVERLLRAWRFRVEHLYGQGPDDPAFAQMYLARLHGALVAPLAAELAGARRLYLALPPAWHELPLAAALGPGGHLVESLALSYLAAPGSLAARRAAPAPAGAALVVGCSDGGRLPAAVGEARAVAEALRPHRPVRLLAEGEATLGAVRAALPDSALVHLAAHAEHRPDNPLFSWARLADGALAVADLGELSLRRRPLVVLSACETGRGRPRGGGLVGMARGFVLAGASGLLASLWKIADSSSPELMADFYAALAGGGWGDPALALAAAQRRSLARGEPPCHWAAFVQIEG